ncbi:MAG: hypothetical protein Crog4KO_21710 [Crocinitomicaceae bacterium]
MGLDLSSIAFRKIGNLLTALLPFVLWMMIGCSSGVSEVEMHPSADGSTPEIVEQNSLDSIVRIDDDTGVFCEFSLASDSTYSIQWGDSVYRYMSDLLLDDYLVNPDRIHINWHNDNFLSIISGTGSDTWIEVVLTRKERSLGRIYWNTLAFDREEGIVFYEYPDNDSTLIAEDFFTQEKLVIGKEWARCASAFPHYCIDSVQMRNGELYVEWYPLTYHDSDKGMVYKERISF